MVKQFFGIFLLCLLGVAASAQSNYSIKPGDVLNVEVIEDGSLNRSVLVLPDGTISFPLAGTVAVSGGSVAAAANALTDALAPNFASRPNVFVSINSLAQRQTAAAPRTISVYLIGQVASPGRYEVQSGTTILQFLAESGGFTNFAAKKRIQIRRTDPSTSQENVYGLNYHALERGTSVEGAAAQLVEGDVIVVPERRLFE
ncbi:MAG: polysaccharide biosynthesis/export family protein [Pseudomonadota bacterium]